MPPQPPPDPSHDTLERVLPRGSRFLTTLVDKPEILRALASEDSGFTAEEFMRGVGLFIAAMGFPQVLPAGTPVNTKAQQALAECDRLDDLVLARVRAALQFEFPVQCEEVLGELTPATGVAAAANLKLVTERIGALRAPVEDAALQQTREAALRRLEEVKLTPEQLAAYAQLATDALTIEAPSSIEGLVLPSTQERHRARVAFYWWLRGWTDIARRVIKNRNHLISLGLASRRVESGREVIVDEPIEGTEPVV